MAENKTGKYFAYAIGEIVLVVVGILIALTISNNNDLKKLRQEEQRYLLALKEEFQFNKQALERVKRINNVNFENALKLVQITGPEDATVTEEYFDIALIGTINMEVMYTPSPGVLNEIINAGKLGGFTDPELKNLLATWEATLERIHFQEKEEVHRARLALMEFMVKNTNVRNQAFNDFGKEFGFGPTKFKYNNRDVLKLPEFEHRVLGFLFASKFLNDNYYPGLEKKIDEILKLVEQNIEK